MALMRSLALMTCLILLRARDVLTNASQSLLGWWPGWVMISTMSPLRSVERSGTMRPFTLAPTQVCADIGVNGVGEIDGRGVARQHDHFAARREGVDLFRVQVHLERGHELAGILHVALPFHQVAQPGDALIVRRRALAALLVFPVRGDALLGDAVHLLGADLDFERSARAAPPRRCAATDRDWAAEWR